MPSKWADDQDQIILPIGHDAFVPERLIQMRAFRGLTLTELADQIGVSFGLISHFERALSEPSSATREALAQVLWRTARIL